MTALRDGNTDTIHQSIPEIFHYLMTTYGQLSPQQLNNNKNGIDHLIYDPFTNIYTVFNKIQDH